MNQPQPAPSDPTTRLSQARRTAAIVGAVAFAIYAFAIIQAVLSK